MKSCLKQKHEIRKKIQKFYAHNYSNISIAINYLPPHAQIFIDFISIYEMAAALPLPLSAHLQRNVLAVYAKIVVNVMTVAITHVPSVGLDFVLPQQLHPLPQCSILFLCVSQFIFSIFFCDHRSTNARTLFPGHAYLQSCTLLPLSVVLWSFYVATAANRLRASRNLIENHALASSPYASRTSIKWLRNPLVRRRGGTRFAFMCACT